MVELSNTNGHEFPSYSHAILGSERQGEKYLWPIYETHLINGPRAM